MISKISRAPLQMLQVCSSTPQMIPHGPLMPLRSSFIDFTMARKSSFHHPSNQSPNEISARNQVLTAIGGSISCNSPHSTFWYRPRASQVDISSIKCRICTRKSHVPEKSCKTPGFLPSGSLEWGAREECFAPCKRSIAILKHCASARKFD